MQNLLKRDSSNNSLDKKMKKIRTESDNYESFDEPDEDEEGYQQFEKCFKISESVLSKSEYILHVTATPNSSDPYVATCLSNNTCLLHKLTERLERCVVKELTEHQSKIIDCKFSSYDPNLLYTGSEDGAIKLWDMRVIQKSVHTFTDTTESSKKKPFTAFDVSPNNRLICAGTELTAGDSYLLFWDVRANSLMGGYWESHTDDITQVKFHPDNSDKLISGSVDGLINVYNLNETSEDEALIDSLNTESSIDELLWFNEGGKSKISCITHVNDLQLWEVDGIEPYLRLTRTELAKAIKRKNRGFIYIASHQGRNSLLVLVGSNYNDGECVRGLKIKNEKISPAVNFEENSQRVRCSWYNENTGVILTGGEKGTLNVWKLTKKL